MHTHVHTHVHTCTRVREQGPCGHPEGPCACCSLPRGQRGLGSEFSEVTPAEEHHSGGCRRGVRASLPPCPPVPTMGPSQHEGRRDGATPSPPSRGPSRVSPGRAEPAQPSAEPIHPHTATPRGYSIPRGGLPKPVLDGGSPSVGSQGGAPPLGFGQLCHLLCRPPLLVVPVLLWPASRWAQGDTITCKRDGARPRRSQAGPLARGSVRGAVSAVKRFPLFRLNPNPKGKLRQALLGNERAPGRGGPG